MPSSRLTSRAMAPTSPATGRSAAELLRHHLRGGADRHQRIAHLVRDARRHFAERRQPLGVQEARLQSLALGVAAPPLGEIVDAPDHAGRPLLVVGEQERRNVGDERTAFALAQLELALGESRAQDLLAQLHRAPPRTILGAQFLDGAIVPRRRRPAERALDRVGAGRDPSIDGQRQDRIGDAAQDFRQVLARAPRLAPQPIDLLHHLGRRDHDRARPGRERDPQHPPVLRAHADRRRALARLRHDTENRLFGHIERIPEQLAGLGSRGHDQRRIARIQVGRAHDAGPERLQDLHVVGERLRLEIDADAIGIGNEQIAILGGKSSAPRLLEQEHAEDPRARRERHRREGARPDGAANLLERILVEETAGELGDVVRHDQPLVPERAHQERSLDGERQRRAFELKAEHALDLAHAVELAVLDRGREHQRLPLVIGQRHLHRPAAEHARRGVQDHLGRAERRSGHVSAVIAESPTSAGVCESARRRVAFPHVPIYMGRVTI